MILRLKNLSSNCVKLWKLFSFCKFRFFVVVLLLPHYPKNNNRFVNRKLLRKLKTFNWNNFHLVNRFSFKLGTDLYVNLFLNLFLNRWQDTFEKWLDKELLFLTLCACVRELKFQSSIKYKWFVQTKILRIHLSERCSACSKKNINKCFRFWLHCVHWFTGNSNFNWKFQVFFFLFILIFLFILMNRRQMVNVSAKSVKMYISYWYMHSAHINKIKKQKQKENVKLLRN